MPDPTEAHLTLFELYLSTAEKVSDRRAAANAWMLSVNSAIVGLYGYLAADKPSVDADQKKIWLWAIPAAGALGSVENQDSPGHVCCDSSSQKEFAMDRMCLTDAQWAKMEPHCLGKATDPGRTGSDGRLFLEAVLWIVRTGGPWRDLPAQFGAWDTVYGRFRYWKKRNVFKTLFEAVSDEPDMEYAMIDATIVRVHRHGQGAKGGLKIRLLANPKAA